MNAELQKLVGSLEAARLEHLTRLMGSDVTSDDIRSLADIQSALTAVREVLAANEPRLGYGSVPSA